MNDEPSRDARGRSRRFDSLAQEAYLNLWRTYDRLRALEDELFAQYGLTAQQYNALRLLRGEHPRKLATLALASRLVSRAPDITRMLDKLEARSLVERERRNENRRVVLVGITAAGEALLADLHEKVQDCHARQLGHMAPDDLKQLIALLYQARRPHEDSAGSWV